MRVEALMSAVLVLAMSGAVQAQSGVQFAPDDDFVSVMVNKRVGAAQWAIVLNSFDETVTGNVFNLDGSDPQFIWCTITDPIGAISSFQDLIDITLVLECSVAQACPALPCDLAAQWQKLPESAVIPGAFFLP